MFKVEKNVAIPATAWAMKAKYHEGGFRVWRIA